MINSNFTLKTLALACCILSGAAVAGHMPNHNPGGGGGGPGQNMPDPLPSCTIQDMQADYIRKLDGVDSGSPLAPIRNADDCYGMLVGNNSQEDMALPTVNRGYLGDGWFNEANAEWWPGQPGAFIEEGDLQNLNNEFDALGNPIKNDPGWVYMGKDEGWIDTDGDGIKDFNGFKGATIPDANTPYTFIDHLFQCSVDGIMYGSCEGMYQGRWKFTPPSEQPQLLLSLLGGAFFDQVAVVFKGGNSFLMYTFSLENMDLAPILAGQTKFEFGGTFDLTGKLLAGNGVNTAGISNVSLWARDPFLPNDVAEPGYLALLGLALLALYRRRQLRS